MDDNRVGTLLILFSATGFGTLGIFGKLAFASGLTLGTVLCFRFLIATGFVWTLLGLDGRLTLLRGRALFVGLGLGALGYAAQSALYFWGLEFMSAGLVGIVLYTYPVLVVLISVVVLNERVTRRTVIALTAALAGVALITSVNPSGADPRGITIVLGAAVVYSAYITISRVTLTTVDAKVLTAHVLPAAGMMFLGYSLATDQLVVPRTFEEWGIVLALGVVATAVPIFAFFAGLARIGASRASIVSTVEPVVTVLLGVAVLGETISPAMVVGGVLVLGGVVLVQVD